MQRLIKFLFARRVLLVFLALEIFSFVLLRKSSPYYSASYFSSSNNLTAFVYNSKSDVVNYFDLEDVNSKLLEENARLKNSLFNNNSSIKYISRSHKNKFETIKSMVINNTINQNKNFITIDIGSSDGVEIGMGVVGGEGVLGRVYAVNENYSTITSILHSKVYTSIKVGKNGVLASMNWDGLDYKYMNIESLPKHEKVYVKDSVFTSGYSTLYPEGIFLGIVEEVEIENDRSFYTIRMKLVNNFSELKYAYLVKNQRKVEIVEIDELGENE